jgi:hypothetical protein
MEEKSKIKEDLLKIMTDKSEKSKEYERHICIFIDGEYKTVSSSSEEFKRFMETLNKK